MGWSDASVSRRHEADGEALREALRETVLEAAVAR